MRSTSSRSEHAPGRIGPAILVGVAAMTVALAACGSDARSNAAERDGKITAVAAFYPVAYAVQRVGGDRVQAENLTPAGAEPHDLELSTDQVDQVLDAEIAFVMGHDFQPSVEQVANKRDGDTVDILSELPIDAGDALVDEDNADTLDPHVWLDPVLMGDLVDVVEHGLVEADPAGKATFEANATKLKAELAVLDRDYRRGLAHCEQKTIVTAHEAFGRMAKRYGLVQEGIAGLSPESEPSAARIAELGDLVVKRNITTIFTEDAVSPKIAQTLARDAGGLKTEVLSPLEALTKQQVADGEEYPSVMRSNLEKLGTALKCPG